MSEPLISIIIPTFNEEDQIRDLLGYLKKNCAEYPHEVIVADGGSKDQTVHKAEEIGVKTKICRKKGRAAQMNEGAKVSKGDILYFLHADTFPPPNFIYYLKESYRKGYGAGCFRLRFDDPHPILKFYGWCTRFQSTFLRFGDQSLFVEKSLFFEVRGFDESLIVMEDQKIVRELKKKAAFRLMDDEARTSARRYKTNGVIRLQAVFSIILLFYYLGVSQDTLVHVYNEFINS